MEDIQEPGVKSKLKDSGDVVLYSAGNNVDDGFTKLPLDSPSQARKRHEANNGAGPPQLGFFKRPTFYYWRNLAGLSGGVLSLLTAYNSLFYVQSSLHSTGGLGSTALAVDYAAQVIACMFVPTLLMKKVGPKWTLILAMIGIATYLGANMYATFESLIPTAIFMGIGFASMWATMNTLVTDLARGYAEMTGVEPRHAISRFFGLYYMVIETGKIWGNLISSEVLAPPKSNQTSKAHQNCGAAYCSQTLVKHAKEMSAFTNETEAAAANVYTVSQTQIFTLCGISLGFCCLAVFFIVVLLDSRKPHVNSDKLLQNIISTVKFMSDPNLILLIVLTVSVGLVQSFYASDITKAFFTCSLGIHQVGRVSICYGSVIVVGSLCMGYLAQLVGRICLIIMAVLLHIAALLVMLLWVPDPEQVYVFYGIAVMWALSVSVWLIQVTALYGQVFSEKHEEAFSNHRLWECIGFVIGFAWGYGVCMYIKIYCILGFLIVGLISYLVVEYRIRRDKNSSSSDE